MKAGIIPNVVAFVPRMQLVINTHTQLVCARNSNYTQYFLLRVDVFGKQLVVSCVNVFHVFVDDALVIVSPPCEVLCVAIRFASCQLLQLVNGACVSSSVSFAHGLRPIADN